MDSISANGTTSDATGVLEIYLAQYWLGNTLTIAADLTVLSEAIRHLFSHFSTDQKQNTVTVSLLALLLLIQAICLLIDGTQCFALGFGDLTRATSTSPAYIVSAAVSALSGPMVQCFYSWRCWKLFGSPMIPGCIVTCSLASTGIWLYTLSLIAGQQNDWYHSYRHVTAVAYALSMAADLLCVSFTIIAVRRARGSSSQSRSKTKMLQQLITLAVSTTGFVTAVNMASMICFLLNNGGDIILLPMIASAYTATILVCLGSRKMMRKELLPLPKISGREEEMVNVNLSPVTSTKDPQWTGKEDD